MFKKIALVAALAFASAGAFALDIGVGVAGATGSSTSAGGAVAAGRQGSALIGVSGGTQTANSTGISGNITTVNSQGGSTISEHQDTAGATQSGGSLGLAAQGGFSAAGSQSSATGSFGLLKGFVFANP